MEKVITSTDPMVLYVEGRHEELTAYAEENQQELFREWTEMTPLQLSAELRRQSAWIDPLVLELSQDGQKNALVQLGSLLGTIRGFEFVVYDRERDRLVSKKFQDEGRSVKHLNEIIRILESHGPLYHKELADQLDMNTSTLTEAMKKVKQTGFVLAQSMGKRILYSLSDTGIRYGRQQRKQAHAGDLLEQTLRSINALLDEAESKEEIEDKKRIILSKLNGRERSRPSEPYIFRPDDWQPDFSAPYKSVKLDRINSGLSWDHPLQNMILKDPERKRLENRHTGPLETIGIENQKNKALQANSR